MIGGTAEAPIDIVAEETQPKALRLRMAKLHRRSGAAVGIGYALEFFCRDFPAGDQPWQRKG